MLPRTSRSCRTAWAAQGKMVDPAEIERLNAAWIALQDSHRELAVECESRLKLSRATLASALNEYGMRRDADFRPARPSPS